MTKVPDDNVPDQEAHPSDTGVKEPDERTAQKNKILRGKRNFVVPLPCVYINLAEKLGYPTAGCG